MAGAHIHWVNFKAWMCAWAGPSSTISTQCGLGLTLTLTRKNPRVGTDCVGFGHTRIPVRTPLGGCAQLGRVRKSLPVHDSDPGRSGPSTYTGFKFDRRNVRASHGVAGVMQSF